MSTYLSVGSNVATSWGDPRATVLEAADALEQVGLPVARQSGVYRTAPIGPVNKQGDFANMVAEVRVAGGGEAPTAHDVLRRCRAVEDRFGRRRDVAMGPRSLDLDILLHGDAILSTVDLVVPHPRMCERRFVLVPLAELAPELLHPVRRRAIRELLADLDDATEGQLVVFWPPNGEVGVSR